MRTVAVIALSLAAPAWSADGFQYDYLEASYFRGELEDDFLPTDFDGWEIRGSKAFGQWTLTGSHESISFDPIEFLDARFEFSQDVTRIGAGYVFSVFPLLNIQPAIGAARINTETEARFFNPDNRTSVSESDTGYFVSLNIRSCIIEVLEAEFAHRFTNVSGDRMNDWQIDLRYVFTPAFAIGAGYRNYEGDAATDVTFRWNF